MEPRVLKTFYVGIKGILIQNGKALLLKCTDRTGRTYWDLPGGRIEHGEDIATTLTRELTEELPVISDIEIGHLIAAHQLPFNLPDGQGLMLLMYTVQATLPDDVLLSTEHEGYKWVSIKELEELGKEPHEPSLHENSKSALRLALTEHIV